MPARQPNDRFERKLELKDVRFWLEAASRLHVAITRLAIPPPHHSVNADVRVLDRTDERYRDGPDALGRRIL